MSARKKVAREAVFDAMIEHGPDGHTDGHDKITDAALTAADAVMFSEAAIERAAKAGFESVSGLMGFPGPFDTAPEPLQKTYRDIARAVVAALREEA